jgi:hypothetical protein
VEIEPAARKRLLDDVTVRGYVGPDGVYKHQLLEHVDQQGTRKIVVRRSGGWAGPDRIQSSEYPVLAVDCWADCSRTAGPNSPKRNFDCIENAWALFRAVDPLLHRIRNQWWGAYASNPGLRVFESVRSREPIAVTKDESHGGRFYAVELGESCVVTAEYNVWCAH